jgi:glycosyltransferase involved in cell wall biosynthesis
MKVGILGTRGIPNHYGGFEQFAEYLSLGLIKKQHEVVVYNSSLHPYKENSWKGVEIIHCKDYEDKVGTAGQFVYDLNCILNARKQNFDILLQLGYTSNSIWSRFLPKKAIVITNMDGLEWKRDKYNSLTRMFLKKAESWAIHSSDHLISDSFGIQKYISETYNKTSSHIAYGSTVFNNPNANLLEDFNVEERGYYLLIARMEPENNIENILDGYVLSKSKIPFIVIGSAANSFGTYLKRKYSSNLNIRFIGSIYNMVLLNNLRYYTKIYFHGHSVGGTNPSLLEAMGSLALIAAHKNQFNISILNDQALYFSNAEEVADILVSDISESDRDSWIKINYKKIEQDFNWDLIIQKYEDLFLKLAR